MLFAWNELLCMHNSCPNNEKNMSGSSTVYLVLKVHIWGIILAREEYVQSFWKSVVSMVSGSDTS